MKKLMISALCAWGFSVLSVGYAATPLTCSDLNGFWIGSDSKWQVVDLNLSSAGSSTTFNGTFTVVRNQIDNGDPFLDPATCTVNPNGTVTLVENSNGPMGQDNLTFIEQDKTHLILEKNSSIFGGIIIFPQNDTLVRPG